MAVTCAYHEKAEAVGACVNCGKLVCNECKVTLKGKIYCNPCMEEMYAEKTLKAESAVPAATTVVVESTPSKEEAKGKAEVGAKSAAKAKADAKTEVAIAATDNTSGQGKEAIFPEELKGFNTGAFLMNWIWGIGNKVWISLLALIPYVNIVIAIILGVKGNEWAWRNKQWESIERFKKVQRTWMWVGIAILIVSLVVGGLAAAIAMLYSSGGEIQFN